MRPELLALGPEALIALANAGLVKRAERDLAAGRGPRVTEDAEGLVTGTFPDGVVASLPAGVPLAMAPCSCGAPTICRHRVALVLAYRTAAAAPPPGAAPPTPAAPAAPWSPGDIADDALHAALGKEALARAAVARRRGLVASLEAVPVPIARLATTTVRFHVPGEPAYATCTCRRGAACEHVAIAAWAFREATRRRLDLPASVELGAEETSTIDDAVLALVEHVLVTGIARLGDDAAPRFARARAAVAGQTWPAVLVDALDASLAAYRARSATFRPGDAAASLVGLFARARVAARPSELPARLVLGTDVARETPLDHVRLVALGARVEADSDARIARVHLAAPDGAVLVASRSFTTSGEIARRPLAGRLTLGALAHGVLVTRAARRQANGALSFPTTAAKASTLTPLEPGAWDELPAPLLVRAASALEEEAATLPPRVLRPIALAATTRVLAIRKVATLGYRAVEQELVARLELVDGGEVRAVRRHDRAAPDAIDALAAALDDAPRFVAGELGVDLDGLVLDPLAVLGTRLVVPDLAAAPATPLVLAPARSPARAPLDAALATVAAVLEEALVDGVGSATAGARERLAAATDQADALGLGGLALRLRTLARERTPGAWLEAALRLELTREERLAAAPAP